MSDLRKRINDVGKYFVSFNITEGITYALTKLPHKWVIPDSIEQFGVSTAYDKDTKGYYFVTKIEDGTDNVFDAIDYVVKINKSIEEKKTLLQDKANELSELFATEPIEKLRRLRFVFDEAKPKRGRKPSKKTNKEESKGEKIEETTVPEEVVVPDEVITGNAVEEKQETENTLPNEEENNSSEGSLMNLAMEMVEKEKQ